MTTATAPAASGGRAFPGLRRGALGSFVARVTGVGLYFTLQVTLAHLLDRRSFGLVAALTAWITVLAVPARLGADYTATRFVATYSGAGDRRRAVGFYRQELRRVGIASVVVASAFAVGGVVTVRLGASTPVASLGLAALTIALMAAVRFHEGGIKGSGQAAASFLPYWVFLPSCSLAGLLVLRVVAPSALHTTGALATQAVATAVAAAVGGAILMRRIRAIPQRVDEPPGAADRRLWHLTSWRLSAYTLSATLLTQSDVLVVSVLLGATTAGPYAVAARVATLLSFFLFAANAVFGPRSAHLHHQGRLQELQPDLQRAVLVVSALSIAGWLALVVLGPFVLGLFGRGFRTVAYGPMLVLGLGQVVNSCTGPVVLLLTMTGHEAVAARIVGIAATVGIGLEVVLGMAFGAIGVAVASAVVVAVANAWLVLVVRRRLGVSVLPARRRPAAAP